MELTLAQKQDAIRTKVKECIALAESKFKIAMPKVSVHFDLRGRAAGMACAKGMILSRTYWLRFNLQHMAVGGKSWDHLINNTVPHEVAHTVCQAYPNLGKNHNPGWKRVCLALGGNGSRCYSQEDAPEAVALAKPFAYVSTSGHTVAVSPTVHLKIQAGVVYNTKIGGKLNKQCSYSTTTVEKISKPKLNVARINPSPAGVTKTATLPPVGSNADRMREFIRINKAIHGSEAFEMAVTFGVTILGQKRSLAQSYVKNNWNRV